MLGRFEIIDANNKDVVGMTEVVGKRVVYSRLSNHKATAVDVDIERKSGSRAVRGRDEYAAWKGGVGGIGFCVSGRDLAVIGAFDEKEDRNAHSNEAFEDPSANGEAEAG